MRVVKLVHGPTSEEYCEVPSASDFKELKDSVEKVRTALRQSKASNGSLPLIEENLATLTTRVSKLEEDFSTRIKTHIAKEVVDIEKRVQALDEHIAQMLSKLIEVEIRLSGNQLIAAEASHVASEGKKRPALSKLKSVRRKKSSKK